MQGSGHTQRFQSVCKVIYFPYKSEMDLHTFKPPQNYGMKVLDKNAFSKTVALLSLETEAHKITKLRKELKKYMPKLKNLKSIQDTDKENVKRLLFNPDLVKKKDDFDATTRELFDKLGLTDDNFCNMSILLTYENWTHTDLIRAILPEGELSVSGFSVIGHIAHLNLRNEVLEYKSVVGQILIDKIPAVKTVVNKTNKIHNVYRNFDMELICGEPNYIASVKENGFSFTFDFSKVYWNPRLGTEHARVVDSLSKSDILFDVFCGIGPFSIPAAKKKCMVYANDLNPESVKWLKENIKLNKILNDHIQVFNMDASDFINNEVKSNLIKLWKGTITYSNIVVVMNLPVLAPEFLKCFKGLLKSDMTDLDESIVKDHLPVVHCYFFSPSNETAGLAELISQRTDLDLNNVDHSIHFVRTVSTTKYMYKIKLVLPLEYMINNDKVVNRTREPCVDEPKAKKLCVSIILPFTQIDGHPIF